MTPHISAKQGEIAEIVFLPGDPKRAALIVEKYLQDSKLVSSVRGISFYTGTYKGKKVTIGASGMGHGSMGIYSFELFNSYGVKRIIRIGSTGSYREDIKVRDIVLVTESIPDSPEFSVQLHGSSIDVATPSEELNKMIENTASKKGISLRKGRVHSTNVFYNCHPVDELVERTKAICVEMESYALFVVAKHLKKEAACLVTVSDNLVSKIFTTPEEREKTFTEMIELALDSFC